MGVWGKGPAFPGSSPMLAWLGRSGLYSLHWQLPVTDWPRRALDTKTHYGSLRNSCQGWGQLVVLDPDHLPEAIREIQFIPGTFPSATSAERRVSTRRFTARFRKFRAGVRLCF